MSHEPHHQVWYIVRVFGVKTCFKMTVKAYDGKEAAELTKKIVKEKTGHDVLACTTVDPFSMKTRAWKNEIIANRSYEQLPPHAY